MTPEQLYAALRSRPITDQRLIKAKRHVSDAVYRAVIEQLRLEGWITRAQAQV